MFNNVNSETSNKIIEIEKFRYKKKSSKMFVNIIYDI